MAEVIAFPIRAAREDAPEEMPLAEMFALMLRTGGPLNAEWSARQREKMAVLMAMSVPRLRYMWDNLGDDSFYGEHDCADIHMALNLKGDGAYCAV